MTWTIDSARDAYNLAHWGGGYFDINAAGHLTARPDRDPARAGIDLYQLAGELRAVSADHLAAISGEGIAALAQAGTVGTLLPGTMLFLGKRDHAPARAMIDAGVAIALATDFNPGTSPTTNFPLVLTLGVSQLHLSVAEVMVAGTVNGAAALGMADRVGQIAAGFSADLTLWNARDVRELPYWYGSGRCRASWASGKPCHTHDLALDFPA